MRVALTAPYADVRAADLVLALDAPGPPPLEALELCLGAFGVQLELLGHSHQVRVAGRGMTLSETVACRPGEPGHLPLSHERRRGAHRYLFTAQVARLRDEDAGELAARTAVHRHGLVGVFAGDAAAFTALRADTVPGGVCWRTWHAYPQTGELVRTTGTVLTP